MYKDKLLGPRTAADSSIQLEAVWGREKRSEELVRITWKERITQVVKVVVLPHI